jgi:glycerol-3-phosphate acyltransferase PlsX
VTKQKNKNLCIGVDLLGNDNPASLLLEVVVDLAKTIIEKITFKVFATEELLPAIKLAQAELKSLQSSCSISFFQVEDTIEMHEDPLQSIRKKKNSSLYQGIQSLQDNSINAFISAGNTGALVSASSLLLPKLPNISRLALLALIPTELQPLAVLDIGANLICKKEHLIQFAMIGAAFQSFRKTKKIKIGLLNIGEESNKGTPLLQETYLQLRQLEKQRNDFVFYGNVEGKTAFQGNIDVLITEGFTGNVFIKTTEGMSDFILQNMEKNHSSKKDFLYLKNLINDPSFSKAILCGTEKIIIKCHGYSSAKSFMNGIIEAISLAKSNYISSLKKFLSA